MGGAFRGGVIVTRVVLVRRSVVKAVSYRLVIMSMDFLTIYLFTGAARIAIGFMVASNVYTSVAYLAHERLWSRVRWGVSETP